VWCNPLKIGVLALQGAVAEHIRMVESVGATAIPIKNVEQMEHIDGLIIPGGESTTIGKLMHHYGFVDAIKHFSDLQKPIFGTCAGLIVLASEIKGQQETYLALINMSVVRNAYGRQRESFEVDLELKGWQRPIKAVFIRAPLIDEVGREVEVLATHKEGIVAVRQQHLLATSFHPELTQDQSMHQFFLEMVKDYQSTGEKK
jgi:5'-phosphate synthase pdxT subunit